MRLIPLIFLFVAGHAARFQQHQITPAGLKKASELLRGSLNGKFSVELQHSLGVQF